ncbi:glucan endo-1,3-beta-glucosidase 8-like [Impatiens glandulifera]|uniref:glucan endo-1,3-beta-glucosidase 8-like n=1 Tax=Impatiens glandulifera TaxID=253017 RepID=UPI001FB18FBF|nr:glucan endo-1,3-beta-glucosidase 8-like [Impatiens glandulifera]
MQLVRAAVLFWTCTVFLFASTAVNSLGVNFGTQASHTLLPTILVKLLKDNGINKIKLFDADSWYLNAFAGTGIEVMPGIPNLELKRLSGDYDQAKSWVKHNITTHLYDGGVKIKYVTVGNEPFLTSYNGSYLKTTLPAIQNIQRALDEAGHGNIKATTPLNADVYGGSVPSEGDFRSDIKPLMLDLVKYLNSVHSPFLVNIYPFLSLYQQGATFPIDFAMFDGNAQGINDQGRHYDNMLDANLDTLAWSLKKAGASNMKIIIGEIGWPTDGDIHANISLAKRFYSGFFKKMAANKGTFERPGSLDYYLFGLIDEDMKSIAPGTFERHWGMFYYDGKPKYEMDMTGGQGNGPKSLVGAKGVLYQDKSWCVFNLEAKDLSQVADSIEYACVNGDCTSLEYGSTCNKIGKNGNISYAFNMYYQMNDQSVEACDFNGLATMTTLDPSEGTCKFIIQIQSGGKRCVHYHGLNTVVGVLLLLMVTIALF